MDISIRKLLTTVTVILIAGCNNSVSSTVPATERTHNSEVKKQQSSKDIKVLLCEPTYQHINYCSDKFTKLLQAEAQKPANFAQNKRLIITKSKMMNLSEDVFEHYLAVLDPDKNQLYPLSQVAINYMDESKDVDSNYIVEKPPIIDYSVASNRICFSGSLMSHKDAYPNVTDVCYTYNDSQGDTSLTSLIETSLKEDKTSKNDWMINASILSRLPFTQQTIDPNSSDNKLQSDFPVSPALYERPLYFMVGGSSDSGFYTLPNVGETQVFVAFGLFEDESDEYVSEDNPDGAYVDQENYLITIHNTRLHYIELGDNFYISPNYKEVYRINNNKRTYIKILDNGRILEQKEK